MNPDDLLLWLSAKRSGSWSQFRAAVEQLHVQRDSNVPDELDGGGRPGSDLPLYHELRLALQRLGHVEFPASDAGYSWRVVPPSLAFFPRGGPRALLCGARSPALLDRLRDIGEVGLLTVDGMPQRIVLTGASGSAMAALSKENGLHIQEAAPSAILSALPGVRDLTNGISVPMPDTPGWTVDRFSPSRLEWMSVTQDVASSAAPGLFRFVMKYQRFYYLRRGGRSYRVPVQVGKYAVMTRRQAGVAYDVARGVFSVPAICRPPLLIERALVLCSGVLPAFIRSSGRVEYADVPVDVARVALQLLCQEVG